MIFPKPANPPAWTAEESALLDKHAQAIRRAINAGHGYCLQRADGSWFQPVNSRGEMQLRAVEFNLKGKK